MSHELRTPMNAILGFAQILALDSKDFNKTQQSNIYEILDAGHHLLTLINDVLDLSKIEAGKLDIIVTHIDIRIVLNKSIKLIEPQAQKRGIIIQNNMVKDEHIVCIDPIRFKQVLVNILSNAVKYNCINGSS